MSDLIDRQAAIDAINSGMLTDDDTQFECPSECNSMLEWAVNAVKELPTAEPTLYGYKIEHLAYIATVMEKEGVTAEYAVRTFDDISRILRMLIDEAREMLEKTLAEGGARMEE